jgi:aspartyl-tRNA(Asn)/glutamyl-tRNA(Gln) amidotransferase subunit A
MEQALAVLERLGAVLVDVQLRPLHNYHDVKTVIAESEIFAVHQPDLQRRAQDYGEDFLGRTLGACLFSAADFVQAQRERKTMLQEFDAMFDHLDLLVTVGNGPAPRLDELAGRGYVNKWQKPNAYNAFSVSGGPTASTCIGFSNDGLPLSMQISGPVFGDSLVLRAAHAYEKATPWRNQRPTLDAKKEKISIQPSIAMVERSNDPGFQALAKSCASRAGLTLSDGHLEQLAAQAPFIFAMAERLRRDRSYQDDPAAILSFTRA